MNHNRTSNILLSLGLVAISVLFSILNWRVRNLEETVRRYTAIINDHGQSIRQFHSANSGWITGSNLTVYATNINWPVPTNVLWRTQINLEQ